MPMSRTARTFSAISLVGLAAGAFSHDQFGKRWTR